MATITSISYLFRSAGSVIGISATSAIFQGVVKKMLTERITGPDAAEVNKRKKKYFSSFTEIFVLVCRLLTLPANQ